MPASRKVLDSTKRRCSSEKDTEGSEIRHRTKLRKPPRPRISFLSSEDVCVSVHAKEKKTFRQTTLSRVTRHHYPLKQSKMTSCLRKAVIRNLKQSVFQNQSGI